MEESVGEVEVRAAGGVVVRRAGAGAQVVVVHRPKYDDWSLPKGKLGDGESSVAAAVREVEEETGLRCEVLGELPAVTYRDPKGRRKRVRYWLMRPAAGNVRDRPADLEVDRVSWVPAAEAGAMLTYPRDRELVELALELAAGLT